jgi:hypothetical protein
MAGGDASWRVVILGFSCAARTIFPLIRRLFLNMEYVFVDRELLAEQDLIAIGGTSVTCLQRTFAPGNIASIIDDVIHDGDLIHQPHIGASSR